MSFVSQRRAVVCLALGGLATALVVLTPPTANASQHGTNYCVSATVAVHADASATSRVVGQMPVTRAWHHYWGVGGWSMGYVRGLTEIRGYIPRNALTRDLGNASPAHYCTAATTPLPPVTTPRPAIRSEAPKLRPSATRRFVCANTSSVRIPTSNQPIAILYRGEEFDLDHYTPSTAYGVGYARGNENVNGMVVADTITDIHGHCKSPYAAVKLSHTR